MRKNFKQFVSFLVVFIMCILLVALVSVSENCKNIKLRSSGDENSHWFHLDGIVVEKNFDKLLVELNDREESDLFFDTTEVSIDCTRCKGDLGQVSKGDVIKFYFFKDNVDGGTVKVEKIVK